MKTRISSTIYTSLRALCQRDLRTELNTDSEQTDSSDFIKDRVTRILCLGAIIIYFQLNQTGNELFPNSIQYFQTEQCIWCNLSKKWCIRISSNLDVLKSSESKKVGFQKWSVSVCVREWEKVSSYLRMCLEWICLPRQKSKHVSKRFSQRSVPNGRGYSLLCFQQYLLSTVT